MNTLRSLWASVQGSPTFMRRVNGWLTLLWIAMIPVSVMTGWVHSVTYISALSLWALVSGHWSAWQAARVEVEQQREVAEMEEHPTEQRVVEELVARTTIEALDDRADRARAEAARPQGSAASKSRITEGHRC